MRGVMGGSARSLVEGRGDGVIAARLVQEHLSRNGLATKLPTRRIVSPVVCLLIQQITWSIPLPEARQNKETLRWCRETRASFHCHSVPVYTVVQESAFGFQAFGKGVQEHSSTSMYPFQ